ncbi:uncharacterized protein G2W53_010061 [Senna tora]|uniref:Uncharacterized protein n=1 Tax=Senna tora TaxID=362788 RepID=A0A835CDM1_9FABA|nr:uncharacterized protein G2W53_010061 [Senna tora]
MGLMISWEVCQVMSKHILNGKPRLNLKRIQEPQVPTCCRTIESDGCLRVVLEIRVDLMLEWARDRMGDVSSLVYTHFEPKTMIESQKNPRKTSSNVLSHK